MASWRPPGSILEAPGLVLEGFWDAQVAPGWPQGLEIPCQILSDTALFWRSNLNVKNFDFGIHPFAFPQKAWPRLGGGGVPPWGPSMELEPSWLQNAQNQSGGAILRQIFFQNVVLESFGLDFGGPGLDF